MISSKDVTRSASPPGTSAEYAYDLIEDMIVSCRLQPGEMLSEKALCDQLQCGRSPVRDALRQLSVEAYVEIPSRRGVQVSSASAAHQIDLLEVRAPLEILMVRLAAQRATEDQRARFRELAEAITQSAAADRQAWLHANRAILQLERCATQNPQMDKTMGRIHGQSRRFWYAHLERGKHFAEAGALSRRISLVIADGDADQAAEGAVALMTFLERMTREAIEPWRG